MYVTTVYVVDPAYRGKFVTGLADLLIFLCVAVADAADNPSWRSGGRIRQRTWERLLAEDEDGDFPNVKSFIGEALAWWHESTTPEVTYAQRPFPHTSQPVVDALSLLQCGGSNVVRGVQAKATYDAPRARVHESFEKFEELQRGEYDAFWAEAVRRFELELRGAGVEQIDAAEVAAGDAVLHFCVFVHHGRPAATDPARDYHPRIKADPPHGRAAIFLHDDQMRSVVRDVARIVSERVLP